MVNACKLTSHLLALSVALGLGLAEAVAHGAEDPPATGEQGSGTGSGAGGGAERDAGGKAGEVRLAPAEGDEAPAPVDAPRPEAVGPLGPPRSLDLDGGAIGAGRKNLLHLGFHQARGYSRLILKTSERVGVEVVPGAGLIKLRLRRTRARLSNNMRFLDTSYFPSAVWRVTPRRQGDDLDLEILMREVVAYQVWRKGDSIRLDFALPTKK